MHLVQRRLRQIKMICVHVLVVPIRMLLMRMASAVSRVCLCSVVFRLPVPVVFRHSPKLSRSHHTAGIFPRVL